VKSSLSDCTWLEDLSMDLSSRHLRTYEAKRTEEHLYNFFNFILFPSHIFSVFFFFFSYFSFLLIIFFFIFFLLLLRTFAT
jgi:hypothetical protein